ncbi:MAG: hypothetical protein IRZ02_07465 [Acidothermus sp.]|nr:hypothetical protein [Acidothermus sp.]
MGAEDGVEPAVAPVVGAAVGDVEVFDEVTSSATAAPAPPPTTRATSAASTTNGQVRERGPRPAEAGAGNSTGIVAVDPSDQASPIFEPKGGGGGTAEPGKGVVSVVPPVGR